MLARMQKLALAMVVAVMLGAADKNRTLSQRRAQAVVDYLVSKGANAANLSAKGYGPDQPVADNKTASGRAANRRVELRVMQ